MGLKSSAGSGADERVLRAANLPAARMLFVAIPEAFEAGQIVQQTRRANPHLEIVARAHFDAEVDHLAQLGANSVIMGEREIAEAMLLRARTAPARAEFAASLSERSETCRRSMSRARAGAQRFGLSGAVRRRVRRRVCASGWEMPAGSHDFGVNLLRLPPGAWSSQRHWHSAEDEFVYVVSGEVTLVTDSGEEVLRAGDCAAFPKNDAERTSADQQIGCDCRCAWKSARAPTRISAPIPTSTCRSTQGRPVHAQGRHALSNAETGAESPRFGCAPAGARLASRADATEYRSASTLHCALSAWS